MHSEVATPAPKNGKLSTDVAACRRRYSVGECEALLELLACIKGVAAMLQAAQGWLQLQAQEHVYRHLMRFVDESVPAMLAHSLSPEVGHHQRLIRRIRVH